MAAFRGHTVIRKIGIEWQKGVGDGNSKFELILDTERLLSFSTGILNVNPMRIKITEDF